MTIETLEDARAEMMKGPPGMREDDGGDLASSQAMAFVLCDIAKSLREIAKATSRQHPPAETIVVTDSISSQSGGSGTFPGSSNGD